MFLRANSEDSDQTGFEVGFVMRRLFVWFCCAPVLFTSVFMSMKKARAKATRRMENTQMTWSRVRSISRNITT